MGEFIVNPEEIRNIARTGEYILELAKQLVALCDEEAVVAEKMVVLHDKRAVIIKKLAAATTRLDSSEISIRKLGLSPYVERCLMRRGGPEISTLTELLELSQSDLMNTRGIGCVKYQEIVRRMHELGYKDFPRS